MSGSLKRKSQSLPRLRKVQFQSKTQSLIKLLSKDLNSSKQQLKQKLETQQHFDIIDPQQRRKQQVQSILLKSKTMISQNRDKIQVAKKFRILKRKSAGPFLTGVDIYKQQQQNQNPYSKAQHLQPEYKSDDSQLQKMLSQKYDDLAELRKMIRKTNKNLGQYKKQTLNIQKNLITMADKYHDVAIDVMSRRKIGVSVESSFGEI